ncbi:CBS domain-containing protein [Streptomyces sp. CS113]|uniref:CBS domain-containing protein n=1 Tax=Streptomyces sp. CS113 TaxID=1982761 RepID=UPI0035940EA7
MTKNGRLRGLVTDRDLTVRVLAEGGDVSGRAEACRSGLTAVAPEEVVDRAVCLMRSRTLRCLPVVGSGRPVGIVALGDLAAYRGSVFTPDFAGTAHPHDRHAVLAADGVRG